MSERIVKKLLENDQVDPKSYVLAMGKVDLDDEVLRTFKRQATGYIKWINGEMYDPMIAVDIENCGTFQDVANILSLYDEAGEGIGFLDMISQGYF